MNYEIIASRLFAKELKRLGKKYKSLKNDYGLLLDRLERNPFEGIDLGHGLRKVRMAISAKNKGKSHGARVITFNVLIDENSELSTCFTSMIKKNVQLYQKKKYLKY